MRVSPVIVFNLLALGSAFCQTYTISTFAGGPRPLNIQGTSASLYGPGSVAVDGAGNVFFTDGPFVLRLDAASGSLTVVAGNGVTGFSGDNGPATSAELNYPVGVAVDSAGNVYIADSQNNRVRKVTNGVITTVVGNGTAGPFGDNGPATSAALQGPTGVAVDSAGNLFIADSNNNRIRKVTDGVITTVINTASQLGVDYPTGIAVDGSGNLYFSADPDQVVFEVANGVVTRVAGISVLNRGFSGDNGPATSAELNYPIGNAVDSAGNLYIADSGNNRIRKVTNGVITTVAGNGTAGFGGDNGPATSAQLNNPTGVAVDALGNLYITDNFNRRIRKISKGMITTIAGGLSDDNGPAMSALLLRPSAVALDSSSNVYIADTNDGRIRKVANGVITTIAGNGRSANLPTGVAVDTGGNVYTADTQNSLIRKVSNGVITTVAGNGTFGFSGDNGPATSAQLYLPTGVAVDSAGNLYIADYGNNRVRKVSNGVITTIAGSGTAAGFSGDNGPATGAQLSFPTGVAVDTLSNIYIADTGNNTIRKVSNGVITTVAGNGTAGVGGAGFGGDNGPATSAQLNNPFGVAVDALGNLFIADSSNNRVRKVSNGVITTIAGNGIPTFSGDGGPATTAQLNSPQGVTVDFAGNVYIADSGNNRIRLLTSNSATCTYSVTPTSVQVAASGGNLRINIQTTAGCSWTIAGVPSWISLPAGSTSSSGPATINLVVASNAGALRSAQISVAGITVTVNQAPNVLLVIVSVTGTAASQYNLLNNAVGQGWILPLGSTYTNVQITADVIGSGTAYLTTNIGANVTPAANEIAHTTFNSPTGGNVVLFSGLTLGPGLPQVQQQATPNSYFLTLVSQTPGAGWLSTAAHTGIPFLITGANIYSSSVQAPGSAVAAYPPDSSFGVALSTDLLFSVSGTQGPSACTYTANPVGHTDIAAGGTFMVTITTGTGCAWTVSNLPDWITVSGSATGSGSGTVTFVIAANSGPPRSAQISAAGITVTVNQASNILLVTTGGVVNAASYTAPVSPGSIAAIFGNFLLPAPVSNSSFPIPSSLGGLMFQFSGAPGTPLFYANFGQVNGQVPWELAGQSQTTITATNNGQTSAPVNVSLATYAPGIFAINGEGTGQGAILDANYRIVDSTNPAIAGNTVVQIFCTGLGPVTNQPATGAPAPSNPLARTPVPATVMIGNAPAQVQFSGLAPGYAGLYQVNALVPSASAKGSAVPVTISIGGVQSNTVAIAVQ